MKREGLATHTRGRHEQHGSPQEWRERRRGRGKFDLKLEVVLIPVSDVDRSKKFYEDLGWTARRRLRRRRGLSHRPVHASRLRLLDRVRQGSHAGRAGSAKGLELIVSDIVAVRAELAERGLDVSEVFHGSPFSSGGRISGPDPERGELQVLRLLRGSGRQPVAAPGSHGAVARSHRFRRSRRSCPWRIWRARCGVRRPPTASTRSAPASATRTGPTGTPRTWSEQRRTAD